MSERLEEIKQYLTHFYNAVDVEEDIKEYIFNTLKIEWLIEQAERVEELEEKIKHQTDHRLSVENNNLKRENQRYREAIEKTLDSMSGYDLFKYGDDLEKALENDSHDD